MTFVFVPIPDKTDQSAVKQDKDGFSIVRRPRSSRQVTPALVGTISYKQRSPPVSLDKLISQLATRRQIRAAQFRPALDAVSTHIRSQIKGLPLNGRFHLVVYGLGKCASDRNALVQLEFCTLLKEQLGNGEGDIYDPQMDQSDYQLAAHFGFKRIESNEMGMRSIPAARESNDLFLFFMPRCPLGLYDNLLQANYSKSQLERLILLGNNIHSYSLRYSDAQLKSKAPFISILNQFACIKSLEFSSDHEKMNSDPSIFDAFNDMALHWWHFNNHTQDLPYVNFEKQKDAEVINKF